MPGIHTRECPLTLSVSPHVEFRPLRHPSWMATLVAFASLLPWPAWSAEVTRAEVWEAPRMTRVLLALSEPVMPTVFQLTRPPRVVVDLPRTRLEDAIVEAMPFVHSVVEGVRLGRHGTMTRLVFDLAEPVGIEHFTLARDHADAPRIVLDLLYSTQASLNLFRPDPAPSFFESGYFPGL